MTFEDIKLDSEELGITLKTARGRGGTVSDIVYRRIKGNNVGGAAIQLNTGYAGQPGHHPRPSTPNKTGTPILKNLLFEDCDFVTGDLGFAATMSGLQEAPVENLCAATARPPHPRWLCAVAVLWVPSRLRGLAAYSSVSSIRSLSWL